MSNASTLDCAVHEKPCSSRLLHRSGLIAALLATALWLLNHHYAGIWHDARIYTLMAVHQLAPLQFAGDPWFTNGAADGFSVFPSIYGGVISALGIPHAAKFLVAFGALLWLVSTYCLCYLAFPQRQAALLFLLLSSVPLAYSPDSDALVLSENFVTSRIFAIPISLAALSLALCRHRALSVAAITLALLLHPLVAIWGACVLVLMTLDDRKLVIVTALGVSVFLLLLLNPMHLTAFDKMSSDWEAVVRETALIVFHKTWPEINIEQPLWLLAALLLAGRLGTSKLSKLYLSTAYVGSFALLASLVVSYYTQNTLLVQMQLWRALWLVTAFGFIAAIDLAWATFQIACSAALPAFLLTTFLLRDSGGAVLLLFIAAAFAAQPEMLLERLVTHRAQLSRGLWKALGFLILLYTPGALVDAHIFLSMDATHRDGIAKDSLLPIAHQIQLVMLPVLCWYFLTWADLAKQQKAKLAVALVAVFIAWAYWDGRSGFQRYVEARYKVGGHGDLFPGTMRAGETVYWVNNPLRVWFDIGAPSYVSSVQAIGIVFSYERMREVKRRLEHVGVGNSSEHDINTLPPSASMNLHRIESHYATTTSASARRLCSDDALTYFIDQTALPDIQPKGIRTEMVEGRRKTYYLYDCRSLRLQ